MEICKEIYRYTAQKIDRLCHDAETGPGRAKLAELRRGIGYAPGALPQLWGTFLLDLPECLYAKGQEPSRAEWAIYTTITLFAMHQQGNDPKAHCMNLKDARLGTSIAKLCHDADGKYTEEDRLRVTRRFMPMATANDMQELVHHLRALIQLLKAESIPLDYPALAVDLYRYQNSEWADSVRLMWGQDFYRLHKDETTESEGNDHE